MFRPHGPFRQTGSALFFRASRAFRREVKKVKPESYVQFTEIKDGQVVEKKETEVQDVFSVKLVTGTSSKVFVARGFNLKDDSDRPQPISASLGPYTVRNPELFTKRYKWCSCGMSTKQVVFPDQPFCDVSHKGTLFRPIRFLIQDAVDEVHLCGCKLSTKAPYCDGETCQQLRDQASKKSSPHTATTN